MAFNLFALLKIENEYQVRLFSLSKELQAQLSEEFISQYSNFISGIDEEIEFTGDWKPDDNQLLLLKDLDGISLMENVKTNNADSFDIFNIKKEGAYLKAIFAVQNINNRDLLLVQQISKSQVIEHNKWVLLSDNNVFNKISEPTLEISDRIVAIIDAGVVKFKSYPSLRCIFDILHCFMEATNPVLKAFAAHSKIECNESEFIKIADSVIRKQITQLNQSGILDNAKVSDIQKKYKKYTGEDLIVNNGKIVLSNNKKEIKTILNFLLENLFAGILSN